MIQSRIQHDIVGVVHMALFEEVYAIEYHLFGRLECT